ncbi:MAG: sensor histidine kinase [Anaerovoracaceae bacterium]
MKYKAQLKLFFADHLWVLILFMLAPVCFMLVNFTVSDALQSNTPYYLFLSFFVLLCFFAYRLYITWDFYALLCKEIEAKEMLIIGEARCREQRQVKQLLDGQRTLYQEELLRLEEQRKLQKLLIYRWVHQLKTPLSVVGLIAENHKNDGDYTKVAKAVTEMEYDIEQVLGLYRLDEMKNDFHIEKVNLYEVSRDCINGLKSMFIEKGIFPKLDVDKSLCVYTDYKWMKFVLYQLLTNGIKYSGHGEAIHIFAAAQEGRVSLSIKDQGCGIGEGDKKRIFDLFFTGENGRLRGESTGLGLYMVKKITDYLGHEIKVESALGQGTTFTIIFE